MANEPFDSSETDDDLLPSHQNRGTISCRNRGDGISAFVDLPYPKVQNDMETQIHELEQEAYSSVLRAFKARSDAITWEKESLMTELRKELRVTDEKHRELLTRVNADDLIQRIRKWRQAGGLQSGLIDNHDPGPSPSISASCKRQKIHQSVPSPCLDTPSTLLHKQVAAFKQPPPSSANCGASVGTNGKKPKSIPSIGPKGRGQVSNRNSSGAIAAIESGGGTARNPLIGQRVKTRWPEDGAFYEAVITDYNEHEGLHALVYDIYTQHATLEWVNLKEISPDDIKWQDLGAAHPLGLGGPVGCGIKKPICQNKATPSAGKGRVSLKNKSKKDITPSADGLRKNQSDDIEILHTESLIKEVERVFGVSNPDPVEMEKARKILKEHEQSLKDAISRLAGESDSESGKYI